MLRQIIEKLFQSINIVCSSEYELVFQNCPSTSQFVFKCGWTTNKVRKYLYTTQSFTFPLNSLSVKAQTGSFPGA